MNTQDLNSDRTKLEQELGLLKTKRMEKVQRRMAEITFEKHKEEDAEKARLALLAKRSDEKEVLGSQILEKIEQLRKDSLIRKYSRYEGADWGGYVPIYKRKITNVAELRKDMPTEREVTEIFQLSTDGKLYYNQIYRALHFAEGMSQSIVRSDPASYGIKLGKPSDFRNLNIISIEAFMKALNEGRPYRAAAERIRKLAQEEE